MALAPSYEVERLIGQGGMSQVYLARDRKHDRPVAIKVLNEDVAAGLAGDRFLREIQLCARLTHPHILPLLDSGYAGPRPFFAMPFVSGETLRERMDRVGRLPTEEAVALARDVADALNYAHAAGVVHRDVKPENILLLSGHAVVLDFGVARAISEATQLKEEITQVGTIVGTAAYMSPEQAAGASLLDGRSDQFSLGVLLFEMLTGTQPFTGPSVSAVIAKRFIETPPPVTTLRPDAPTRVSRAIAQALAVDPGDRFATLDEFSKALDTPTGELPALLPPGPEMPSIAVVPFANVGGDPENEYLSDGITDEVISALSRLRTIRVAARTSSYALRSATEDVAAIGARLKVRTILEGSVRRSGKRIRVTARLVNTRDGFQVWSEQFDREIDDVFAIQDEISAAIVRTLEATFLGGHPAGALTHTTGVDVYELYLKGRFFWNKRTEAHLGRAVDLFTAALAKDTRYAPAYAGLADAWAVLGTYGARPPASTMPLARENAERALALDPSLAEAQGTIGLVLAVYEHRWAEAEAAFKRAIALDPSSPKARHWYSVALLGPLGRHAEALAEANRALALDPLSLIVKSSVALAHFMARDFDAAIAGYRDVLALEPAFGMAHFFLAQALLGARRSPEAAESVERAIALTDGSPEMLGLRAQARAAAGDATAAQSILGELEQMRHARYVSAAVIAQVCTALGRIDDAVRWLTRAYEERDADLIYLATRPAYDSIRATPVFRALLKKVGLRNEAAASLSSIRRASAPAPAAS